MSTARSESATEASDVLRTGEAGGQVIRGGLIRAGGYSIGVLLSVATSAILLRHLGVEQFGQYGTIAAIAGIVLGLTDAGLTSIGARELSLLPIGPGRERMASTLLAIRFLTTSVGVLVALGFTVLVYSTTLSVGMALVGLSVILISVQSMATVSLYVSLRFLPLTAFEIARQVLTLAAIALLALSGAGLLPFFAVQIPIAALLLVATLIYVRRSFHIRLVIDWTLMREVVIKTLPMSAAVAMNILYLGAMVVVVSLITSDYETGLFVTSARIMEVLILLPGITISLALPVLSVAGAEDHKRLSSALQKMTEVGFLVSATIVLAIVIMAPSIIQLLGGPAYAPASSILRLQVFALIGIFMAQTLQFALISLRRQRSLILANGTALCFVIAMGIALTSEFGPKGAAIAVVLAEALLVIFLWIAVHRAAPDVQLHLRFVFRLFVAAGIGGLVGVIPGITPWITGPIAVSLFLLVAFFLRVFPSELFVAVCSPIMGTESARELVHRRYGRE